MKKALYQKIHLVIPRLIEQKTWGGDYIVKSKNWDTQDCFSDKLIGQSFELHRDTKLALGAEQSDTPLLAYLSIDHEHDISASIRNLAKKHGASFLGEKIVERYGLEPGILIKYTHARGNSFQLHVRENIGTWQSKPETWFYMEKGLLTLGVRKDIPWMNYKKCLLDIDQEMNEISQQILAGKISLETGQNAGKQAIRKHDPWQYVNLLEAEKDSIVDLSGCALHHSWEEDESKIPQGNVVYELQADVGDDVSSIRGFDKGKIKSDGTLRPVHIEDYFEHIDRDPEYNRPERHLRQALTVRDEDNLQVRRAVDSPWYSLEMIMLNGRQDFTADTNSYHHLFVRSGAIAISGPENQIKVTAGHSVFVPANCPYSIESLGKETALLKSFIS